MKKLTSELHYNRIAKIVEGVSLPGDLYLGQDRNYWMKLFKEDPNLNNYPKKAFDSIWMFGKTLSDNICSHKHLIIFEFLGIEPEFRT